MRVPCHLEVKIYQSMIVASLYIYLNIYIYIFSRYNLCVNTEHTIKKKKRSSNSTNIALNDSTVHLRVYYIGTIPVTYIPVGARGALHLQLNIVILVQCII